MPCRMTFVLLTWQAPARGSGSCTGTWIDGWSLCSLRRKGLSHHPDEYATPEHMTAGVRTLAIAMARLAGSVDDAPDRTEL